MRKMALSFLTIYVLLNDGSGNSIKSSYDGMDQATIDGLLQNKIYQYVDRPTFDAVSEVVAKPIINTTANLDIQDAKDSKLDAASRLDALIKGLGF